MDKAAVIAKLREHEGDLKAAGIMHLSLFGSLARGDANPLSDIDLLADFDKSKQLTLVSVGSLESRLADLLGAKVDISSIEWMQEDVRRHALREALLAF